MAISMISPRKCPIDACPADEAVAVGTDRKLRNRFKRKRMYGLQWMPWRDDDCVMPRVIGKGG